jgi:dienelactone hydrolase
MWTLIWCARCNTEQRAAHVTLALALACLVLLTNPVSAQFGFGAEEKKPGSFPLDPSNPKVVIHYWQFEPKKANSPLPAILVFHGIEGLDAFANKGGMAEELSAYKDLCKVIAEKGYLVRFVHYMECKPVAAKEVAALKTQIKDSLTAPPDNVAPQAKELFTAWMGCAKRALDDLRDPKNPNNKNVDPKRVGAAGMSLGGFIILSLAVTDAKFDPQALVVVCGGLPEELHAKVTRLPPVLMLCGTKDEVVPMKHAYKVRNCLEDKDCSVILLQFACYHMFMTGISGTQPAPQPDRGLMLRAADYAGVFLEHSVKRAPTAGK